MATVDHSTTTNTLLDDDASDEDDDILPEDELQRQSGFSLG